MSRSRRYIRLKNSNFGNWQDYQEATARVFWELGCAAEVEKRIVGARGRHEIDVYVSFRQFGYECRWIVECKLTAKPVSKADVLTLLGVVDDVGADRGCIFCESGFQSGANTAARNTNILRHSSLEDFRRTARLNIARTELVLTGAGQSDAAPVHLLPNGDQPHHLLTYGSRVLVANWGAPQAGNIAIIDLATRSSEGVVLPRKHRLVLLLALDFNEVSDPAGVAMDALEWKFLCQRQARGWSSRAARE